MTPTEILAEGLDRIGLERPPETIDKFAIYLGELEKWKPVFGIVGAGGEDLVVRHLLDSLAGVPSIRRFAPGTLADVGSGAGFPGIPLAMYLPDTMTTLIEPSRKRCAFLRSVAALMGLANIRIFEGELALVRDMYDCVTFRAFRPLDGKLLRRIRGILAPRGAIAAYKGRRERIGEETEAAESLGLLTRVEPLTVPFLDEPRHLVWITNPSSREP